MAIREDGKEFAEIDYDEVRTDTAKAILFIIDGEEWWVPKSVCFPHPEDSRKPGVVYVEEWWATDKGMV